MYGFNNTKKKKVCFLLYFMGKIRAKVTSPPPIKRGPPTLMSGPYMFYIYFM